MPAVQPLPAAAGRLAQAHLWWSDARCWAGNRRPDTGARCGGQGESPGDVWALLSIRTPHCDERLGTAAEEVDEGVERHGADWQGIKEPYRLELMPSMGAIRPWGHHAIRMKAAFWPWMAASCWTIQMPIWGESSRGEACPTMHFRWRP